MRPIRLGALSSERSRELDGLYRGTRDVRVRTRAQMVLLAAEQGLVAVEIGAIVRQDEGTVRRWFARYLAEVVEGLWDAPRSGAPPTRGIQLGVPSAFQPGAAAAERLWPPIDEAIVNRHFATLDVLDAAVALRCRGRLDDTTVRLYTDFHWWHRPAKPR